MKAEIAIVICAVLLVSLTSSCKKQDSGNENVRNESPVESKARIYSGTWSNKSERNLLIFSLRHDERGTFSNPLGPMLLSTFLRWIPSTDGITLIIAGDGSSNILSLQYDNSKDVYFFKEGYSTNLVLHYDASKDIFLLRKPGKDDVVFYRINTTEPPDYEAQHQAKLEREYNDINNRRIEPPAENVTSIKELMTIIQHFAENSNKRATMKIESSNRKSISISRANQLTSVTIQTMSAGTYPKGIFGLPSEVEPTTELEINRIIPRDRATEFVEWLQEHQIKHHVYYYLYRSPWKLEAYDQLCEANILSDPHATVETVNYAVTSTMAPFTFPVITKTVEN